MKPIRNSAKAIIIKDGSILLTKNQDPMGFFYLYPGGGQEKGETLSAAVVRECMEETGCRVTATNLLFIREYIGINHAFAAWDADIHQVEFYFECDLESEPESFQGSVPDDYQVGVEWVRIDELERIRLYPSSISTHLTSEGWKGPSYVGDVN